jgi:hypothetical protein
MDNFLGSDFFSGGGFGDNAILPDLDLQNAFQSWLSDGNEGTFSDFMAEANGQDASSSDDASGNDAASDKTDTSLIAPERDKFEYGGLLSGKPMIGLDRSIMQPSEAAPPVPARSFMSFAGVPTSRTQPLDAQPIGDDYGPPIMPLTVESRVNVDRLTPPAQGFLDKIGSEHFPGLRAISGFRDPEHNRRVGGASGSRHTIGDAIDFDVSQLNDEQKQRFMNIATDSGARGIGVYPSGRSVHVDFRETPAVWGGNRSNPYSGNQNPSAYPEWAQPTVSAFAEGNTGRSQTNDTYTGAPSGLFASESGGQFTAQNDATGAGGMKGHFGRVQFGQARLQDAVEAGAIPRGTTPEKFMASPELQEAAERWHFADIDRNIERMGIDTSGRQTINGVPITRDGLVAVAHLGGINGMRQFVETDGRYNPRDANGTRLMDYFTSFASMGDNRQSPSASAFAADNLLYRGELNNIPSNELRQFLPYRGELDNIPSNELLRLLTARQAASASAFAADGARASAVNRAPDASAFRGSNDRPFETFPTTQAEIISDTPGLLSGNRAMSGPAPLSNMPTIPGAVIPDRLIGEAAPAPMPSAIRTAPANARQLRAKNPPPDETQSRATPANTARGRTAMSPNMNELPPEYFTADTGGNGMGAMRFIESEFARRDQSPAAFGGLGAAISGGAASVGSAVRNALGLGGGEALPPPPRGQEPVARAMPVGDQRVGDQRINPPLPQLGMITWGEGGQRNAALMERWRGQVAEVDELERRGIPRAEAVALINSPRALELRLARVAEEREKRERAEFLAGNRDILGGQAASPPAAPATGPATTAPAAPAPPQTAPPQTAPPPNQPPPATGTAAAPGQPPAPQPISAINEFDARRERINRQIADLTFRLAAAPSETARKQTEFLIKGLEQTRDAIPDPLNRIKRDAERKKAEAEIAGEQKPPSGYRTNPTTGRLEPIPGGPGEKIDGEIAGRIGLAKTWLENDANVIEQRLEKNVFGGAKNTAAMVAAGAIEGVNVFGGRGHSGGFLSGEAGETFRKMQSGAEVLTRLMTGAGMNIQEARQYAERYLPGALDTNATIKSKFSQLKREISDVSKVASRGRGDLITGSEGQPQGNLLAPGQSTTIDGVTIRRKP